MNGRRVTVFGGTGFLGRHIVAALDQAGWRVRAAARRPDDPAADLPASVERVPADVRQPATVAAALGDADAAVNAVGLYLERRGETFAAVHVDGARQVAAQAAKAGLTGLVHISGIGADPASESRYVAARAAGETAARDAFAAATILRPSVLFGPGDAFFNSLATIARMMPVFPLFGHGETRLQPVFVADVAAAVAKSLALPAARGQTYELGGPRSYTYRQLIGLVLKQIGLKRGLLPVPFVMWEAQAAVMQLLPRPPVTHDQIVLMKRDNVPALGTAGFAELGIEPASVENILPSYLGSGGR